jgi:hypothetical protein
MLPAPLTFVPGLVLFIVIGLVHAIFPVQMYGYWRRIYNFWMPWQSRILRGFPDSPGGMRAFGIVFATLAVGMLTLYLWQLLHLPPQ